MATQPAMIILVMTTATWSLDKNKSIAAIEYNHLNLPAKVMKTDGQYVREGQKTDGTVGTSLVIGVPLLEDCAR